MTYGADVFISAIIIFLSRQTIITIMTKYFGLVVMSLFLVPAMFFMIISFKCFLFR